MKLYLKIFNMNVDYWRSLAESPISAVERKVAIAAGWLVFGTLEEVG